MIALDSSGSFRDLIYGIPQLPIALLLRLLFHSPVAASPALLFKMLEEAILYLDGGMRMCVLIILFNIFYTSLLQSQ